jgi:tartrate-resistant acid phosphatase type 5
MIALLVAAPSAFALTVAVIGDFGSTEPAADQVAALVASWSPDMVLTTGDNNYPNGAADTMDPNIGKRYHAFIGSYTGAFGQGAAENKFFPALGNHDWGTGTAAPSIAYFALPGNERYYDVQKGLIHAFVVDSDPHEPDGITVGSKQAAWLQAGLAASKAPYRFVFLHHPPYSSGAHGSTPTLQWPYASWGATVVLAGHDHHYERIRKDGIVYLVDGLGGRETYPVDDPIEGSVIRFNDTHGAVRITVDETAAVFEFVTIDGKVVDRFSVNPARR